MKFFNTFNGANDNTPNGYIPINLSDLLELERKLKKERVTRERANFESSLDDLEFAMKEAMAHQEREDLVMHTKDLIQESLDLVDMIEQMNEELKYKNTNLKRLIDELRLHI